MAIKGNEDPITWKLPLHTSDPPIEQTTMSEFAWKRQELAAKQAAEPVKKRRVLVLYTGGTIGMKWTDKGLFVLRAVNVRAGYFYSRLLGYQPVRNHLMEKVHTYPMLCEKEHPISDEDREIMDPLIPHTLP